MGLLFCREKSKGSICLLNKQADIAFARQYTFLKRFLGVKNFRRMCAASAYKRTVVFKWAAIYKRLDPYLLKQLDRFASLNHIIYIATDPHSC